MHRDYLSIQMLVDAVGYRMLCVSCVHQSPSVVCMSVTFLVVGVARRQARRRRHPKPKQKTNRYKFRRTGATVRWIDGERESAATRRYRNSATDARHGQSVPPINCCGKITDIPFFAGIHPAHWLDQDTHTKGIPLVLPPSGSPTQITAARRSHLRTEGGVDI